jgi:hypothetical protein
LFERAKENYTRDEQMKQQAKENLKIAKGGALKGSINFFKL